MSDAGLFDAIAADLALRPGVERNRRGSLTVPGSASGAVRAMTSTGRIVVKLDPARTAACVADGVGEHYKGQVNAWLALTPGLGEQTVLGLVEEALSGP